MSYHCLDCGTKLEQLNHNESTDKYYCSKCDRAWFKVRRLIVEWVKEKK